MGRFWDNFQFWQNLTFKQSWNQEPQRLRTSNQSAPKLPTSSMKFQLKLKENLWRIVKCDEFEIWEEPKRRWFERCVKGRNYKRKSFGVDNSDTSLPYEFPIHESHIWISHMDLTHESCMMHQKGRPIGINPNAAQTGRDIFVFLRHQLPGAINFSLFLTHIPGTHIFFLGIFKMPSSPRCCDQFRCWNGFYYKIVPKVCARAASQTGTIFRFRRSSRMAFMLRLAIGGARITCPCFEWLACSISASSRLFWLRNIK